MAPGTRVSKCQISRPILIGNDAKPLTPEERAHAHTDHTHTWRIFVEGVDGEDISKWIKKVVFKLHDTYNNSTRSIESLPFEVIETGWGEFDIMIRIFFMPETHEKSLTFYHRLKLHPYGPRMEEEKAAGGLVESVQYEEIVFNEPFEYTYKLFSENPIGDGHGLAVESEPDHPFSQQLEQDEADKMELALQHVKNLTDTYKQQLNELQSQRLPVS
ncbi:NuA4 and Swr1 complex YEATS family subunit Yaf9 [Schizosaccharomyces osmophilus]|uniref:Protein AF-9 homolog n=1 Tax=Schizosaccharomyces osmophilus TaxID=2545709 RepID=A0AAE9WF25_9SCHI|nr:NuA4 and Swr1 complex YEATS family subunit Yaf9 [Schizosaccharomyces osmophilus]WBW74469.1 NuA4 and Swr1 complex YEATS family subunit Yaf9 [Schizosaccharomyces osmophilus]